MSTISPLFLLCVVLFFRHDSVLSECDSCLMHQYMRQASADRKFEQTSKRFWEFSEESNSWVEVELPYDLVSCTNGNCTVVGSIQDLRNKNDDRKDRRNDEKKDRENEEDGVVSSYAVLPLKKRVSLTKMSESSVWVTGQSGSIYERFWNGLQWVIAPHELPLSAGYAVSVFFVNQSILALSEAGVLYQMRVTEDFQPVWVEFMPEFDEGTSKKEMDQSSSIQLSSGVVSNDKERMYFCTKNGHLWELLEVDPPRWVNHGRPKGVNIAAIADAVDIRRGLVFTVSVAGDLYEYDQSSKPPWKKHIHLERSAKNTSLAPSKPCSLHGVAGSHSVSLFLLTKAGELIERRLHWRKWKWVAHGNPRGHSLSSITCISQQERTENPHSLFVTTADGFVFEYHIQQNPDSSEIKDVEESWHNHEHPPHAKAARGISGLQLQTGRLIFPLDDGRLAELHLSGLGGETVGPNTPITTRRKSLLKYVWSFLDAPQTEGWNAEYCTEERGPSNCMMGTKDEMTVSRWRKDGRTQQNYLSPNLPNEGLYPGEEDYVIPDNWIGKFFRLRLMQGGKSFFLITDNHMTFEYLNTEHAWFWLRHEHPTGMKGAVGNYNGSLFLVDDNGSLLIRERSSSDLAWINCTAMRKGRQVIGGPPWDGMPGETPRAKLDNAIFFVGRNGTLLQFTVALRKFKWKDCKSPPGIQIASIVDQEGFRENIVFVVGNNGRLYQYNKVTKLWHEHYQSQHLVLSRSPGTAMRPSAGSLKGSIFMLSEDGGLVEYQWSSSVGWNWIEHGKPRTNVMLVGAPGPCLGRTELFFIGSDGSVYVRYFDQGEWKWRDWGFPNTGYKGEENERQIQEKAENEGTCVDEELTASLPKIEENSREIDKHCNPKVASTRPIPFSEDSVIFELQDGRLAEMKRIEDEKWIWSRTIGTPTSLCMANFWMEWLPDTEPMYGR